MKLKQVKDTWMLSQGGFSLTALTLSVGHQVDSDDRPSTQVGHQVASIALRDFIFRKYPRPRWNLCIRRRISRFDKFELPAVNLVAA